MAGPRDESVPIAARHSSRYEKLVLGSNLRPGRAEVVVFAVWDGMVRREMFIAQLITAPAVDVP